MSKITKEQQIEMLARMLRIRYFEEKAMDLYSKGEFPGSTHLSIGQEASIVGACMALRDDDYIVGTHRSHGHSVGKNADVKGLMAELLGKVTGVNRGKGGSMHLADKAVGSLGETSIVGSGPPIACGAALASKIRKTGQVCLVFYSDGAANQGAVHEAMNIAAIWDLPVIFACENNGVAVSTLSTYSSKLDYLSDRAVAYGMSGSHCDGQDPIAVYEMVSSAVAHAREGKGPSIVEMKTYRFREHGEGALFRALLKRDPYYRNIDEHNKWLNDRDPIKLFTARLLREGTLTESEIQAIKNEEMERIEDATKYAQESPFPDPSEAFTNLYTTPINN